MGQGRPQAPQADGFMASSSLPASGQHYHRHWLGSPLWQGVHPGGPGFLSQAGGCREPRSGTSVPLRGTSCLPATLSPAGTPFQPLVTVPSNKVDSLQSKLVPVSLWVLLVGCNWSMASPGGRGGLLRGVGQVQVGGKAGRFLTLSTHINLGVWVSRSLHGFLYRCPPLPPPLETQLVDGDLVELVEVGGLWPL